MFRDTIGALGIIDLVLMKRKKIEFHWLAHGQYLRNERYKQQSTEMADQVQIVQVK